MNRKPLFVSAALAFAVFSLTAFDNYNQAIQAGRTATQAKKFDEAAKAYEEAGKLAKTAWQEYQVIFSWAEALRSKKSWAEAEKKMSEILANDKMTPVQKASAQLYLGHYKNWQGKKDEALVEYGKVIAMGTKSSPELEAYNASGNLLNSMKKYPEAVELFRKVLAAEKVTPYAKGNASIGIARAAYLQKKYEEALKGYQEIAADETMIPNHRAEAYCGIGRCYAGQQKYDESLDAYRKIPAIAKIAPYYVTSSYREPFNNLVYRQKKFDDARKLLDEAEASSLLPKNQKGWISDSRAIVAVQSARAALLAKKYEVVEKELAAVKSLQGLSANMKSQVAGLDVELSLARGRQLRAEKKYAEAEACFKKALEVNGASVSSRQSALHETARILMTQKKLDEAQKYLDEAQALSGLGPNLIAMNNNLLADFCISQKKYDEAIQAIEKTLSLKKLNPSWIASSYSKLASIYFYWKKDLAKANEYIKKADTVPGATWGKNPALAKAIQKALDAANK